MLILCNRGVCIMSRLNICHCECDYECSACIDEREDAKAAMMDSGLFDDLIHDIDQGGSYE